MADGPIVRRKRLRIAEPLLLRADARSLDLRTTRRALLRGSLGASAALLAGCDSQETKWGFLGLMERVNLHAQQALFDPERLAPEEPESALTPDADFPTYMISPFTPRAPSGWRLQVGGLVERPGTFSVADLQRLDRVDYRIRHHCVEGWSAVTSWHGCRVRDLARLVGMRPEARYVEFRSFDLNYWSSWDLPSAFHPQTILAYGRNGVELPPAYGAPLRLYSGVKLGYKMVKYLTEVNFLAQPSGGFWEDQGYEWFAGV